MSGAHPRPAPRVAEPATTPRRRRPRAPAPVPARPVLLVAGPAWAREALAGPLAAAGLDARFVPRAEVAGRGPDPFGVGAAAARADPRPDGVLLVAPENRSPARLLPGPVVAGVAAGVVQADAPGRLGAWAAALAPAARGSGARWAALAMGKTFFLDLAGEVLAGLREGAAGRAEACDWRSEHTSQEELCAHFARGPRLAVYLGHGREVGWTGYRGLRLRHLEAHAQHRPSGAIVAFTCNTLKRTRGVVPFGCRWVAGGRAAAYLAPAASLRLHPGGRLAVELGRVLAGGAHDTLGAAVAALHARLSADPAWAEELRELRGFRLVGNPLQPLY